MAQLIQLRGDTAANWQSENPILAERELAIETDSKLYKIGDGVTAWNSLPYAVLTPIANTITMNNSAHPTTPSQDTIKVYGKDIANRMLLRILGPAGISTPLQPSLFQNNIAMIAPSRTTALTTFGTGLQNVGTVSNPTPTESTGFMANFATSATSSATAGTAFDVAQFFRGTVPGGSNGFFFNARVFLPDANYDRSVGGSVGTRVVVGLTAATMSATPTSDDVPANSILFQRVSIDGGRHDTNWMIASRDATLAPTLTDTGMSFVVNNVYDFWLFCPPLSDIVHWRIDNVTTNTTVEGLIDSTQANVKLPLAGTPLRGGIQLFTQDATTRNIRMQRIYCESDR